MTTKTTGKNPQETPGAGPSQQQLQAAQHAHTLAHLLYGQMAAAYPWIHPYGPMPGASMSTPMTMAMGQGMYGPTMGPQPTAPWMQTWAGQCGVPTSGTGPVNPWAGFGFRHGPDFGSR